MRGSKLVLAKRQAQYADSTFITQIFIISWLLRHIKYSYSVMCSKICPCALIQIE